MVDRITQCRSKTLMLLVLEPFLISEKDHLIPKDCGSNALHNFVTEARGKIHIMDEAANASGQPAYIEYLCCQYPVYGQWVGRRME